MLAAQFAGNNSDNNDVNAAVAIATTTTISSFIIKARLGNDRPVANTLVIQHVFIVSIRLLIQFVAITYIYFC